MAVVDQLDEAFPWTARVVPKGEPVVPQSEMQLGNRPGFRRALPALPGRSVSLRTLAA